MGLVSHGELEVAYVALSGDVIWATSGADIFTGVLTVTDSEVHVEDFHDNRYVLDLKTGATRSFVRAPRRESI
ncbi:MAG: hypothetical protein IV100_05170 [Myxococcales bacterium]|nr:hypothetical protein [Myxococcales bacterium]